MLRNISSKFDDKEVESQIQELLQTRGLQDVITVNDINKMAPYLTISDLENMTDKQASLIAKLYKERSGDRHYDQIGIIIEFLNTVNKHKPDNTPAINLLSLTQLAEDSLMSIFCYGDKYVKRFDYRNILRLIEFGYLDFDKMLELSMSDPGRLYRMIYGWEGDELKYLIFTRGYKYKDFLQLDNKIQEMFHNLPEKYSREHTKPDLRKHYIDKLPLPKSMLDTLLSDSKTILGWEGSKLSSAFAYDLISPMSRDAIYKSLDIPKDLKYNSALYIMLLEKALSDPKLAFVLKDPITSRELPGNPDNIFVSALGVVFDISNPNEGIAAALQHIFNRNAPQYSLTPCIFNADGIATPLCELDLKILLVKVLTNDLVEKNSKNRETVRQLISQFIKNLSKPQIINIYKHRIIINYIIKESNVGHRIAMQLDEILLYEIFADIDETFHDRLVRKKTSNLCNFADHYSKTLVNAMMEYCQEKGNGLSKTPDSRQFVKDNMQALLQINEEVFNRIFDRTGFSRIFPYLSFSELKNMTEQQSALIARMYEEDGFNYTYDLISGVFEFLRDLNKYKPNNTQKISLINLFQIDNDFLMKVFGYVSGISSKVHILLEHVESGYLDFEKMLELSKTNLNRLYSLAFGYEGRAIVYLTKGGYTAEEISALEPELLTRIQSLPREQSREYEANFSEFINKYLAPLPPPSFTSDRFKSDKYAIMCASLAPWVAAQKLQPFITNDKISDFQLLYYLKNVADAEVIRFVSYRVGDETQKNELMHWADSKTESKRIKLKI